MLRLSKETLSSSEMMSRYIWLQSLGSVFSKVVITGNKETTSVFAVEGMMSLSGPYIKSTQSFLLAGVRNATHRGTCLFPAFPVRRTE